jgi:hypothetical protein
LLSRAAIHLKEPWILHLTIKSGSFTKNWRLTFKLNAENEIIELDLEDYH